MRPPFRARFAMQRIFNLQYHRRLSKVLASPIAFYMTLLRKLLPGSSHNPVNVRLKDGQTIRVREFWAIFLFDEVFLQQCYEAPEILKRSPVNTIIDVGANIGLFTLRMKQIWPQARIIAVEPHPDNFSHLYEHIEINHVKNITALQKGISDRCGCFDLYISPRNIGGHSMYKKSDRVVQVETCILADALAMLGPENTCDLLKIDCEGCEYPLLTSLTQEIADRIGCIIFEPENGLYDVGQLNQKLVSLGFKLSRFSNLVVAAKA